MRENNRHALKLQAGEVLEDHGDTKLYQNGNRIGLVRTVKGSPSEVLYFMQFQHKWHSQIGHQAISQIKVWRNPDSAMVGDTAARIFFDYLLPIEGVVITDSLHTKLGRAFWLKRIKDAFDRGFNVYYLQLMQGKNGSKPGLLKIGSPAEFDELSKTKEFWGAEDLHRARKIIISEIDL